MCTTHCFKTKCIPSYRRLLTPHSSLDRPCFNDGQLIITFEIGMTSYSLASVWCRTADYSVLCLRLRGPPFRLHCLLAPHLDGVKNCTWQPKYLTISLLVLVSVLKTFILVLVSVLKTFTSTLRHLPNVPVQMLTWFFYLWPARKSPERSAHEESGARYLFIRIIVKLYDWGNFFNQARQAFVYTKFKVQTSPCQC